MRKSTIVFIAAIFLILGTAGGYLIVSSRNKNASTFLNRAGILTKEKTTADLTYQDESGFSFGYPKGVKITDVTPDDDQYYSQLEITKGDNKITISVKDAKEGFSSGQATLVGAVSLAGMSAKQYASGGQLITAAFDKGVLYLIEGPKDAGFWEDVQNLIASSFSVGPPQAATADSSGDNAIYEEEEVIE